MISLTFEELRFINIRRCNRWHANGGIEEWSLSDWGVAMAGEAGEACNNIKKLNRLRDRLMTGDDNSGALLAALGSEIADTVIYADILAARINQRLESLVIDKFNKTSRRYGFPEQLKQLVPVNESEVHLNDLAKRIRAYYSFTLEDQPPVLHTGTTELISDLWRAVQYFASTGQLETEDDIIE